jgi:Fe-S oxidoreductase
MSHDKDPRYMPSYKVVRSLGRLYKKRGRVNRAQLEEMKELVFRNCALCGRCYCPFGIDIPNMIAFARTILRSQGIYGMYPHSVGGPEAEYRDSAGKQEELSAKVKARNEHQSKDSLAPWGRGSG